MLWRNVTVLSFLKKPKYRWSSTKKMKYMKMIINEEQICFTWKEEHCSALWVCNVCKMMWNQEWYEIKTANWQIWKRETWASKPSLESGTCSNILHITFLIVIINCYFLSFLFFSQYRCIIISFSFLFFVFLFFLTIFDYPRASSCPQCQNLKGNYMNASFGNAFNCSG